ncbi:nf-x1 finger and helicase domain protein [Diplodia corticola]|uniref:Nf-x1 finger and helicase domain protein n=1 Tax=Diplodia corticola TaxID=236234 RepID=A0A1J9QZU2_9PEZI|nr:nf-x1 finger and helicase domain protein [Diplodia corticola]OJD33889.1 nf-x1 finger and helicase domain protein [Diplodia corticola]
MANQKPCRFFRQPGGCRFGSSCKFSHGAASLPDPNRTHRRPTPNENRNLSNSEVEFRNWRFMIPKEGDLPAPLGPQLSTFFQKGAELVASDAGIRQDVISRLASSGGLARVRELAEQDYASLNDRMKLRRFLGCHVPFFQIITHPDVLSSIVLEQPVGNLFTFVYGINGQRALQLFSLIADLLSNVSGDTWPAASLPVEEVFQLTFHVLSKLIDINGGAHINPDVTKLAASFSVVLGRFVEEHGEASFEKPRAFLARIEQRLGIGQAIPQLAEKTTSTVKQTSFGVPIDPPGRLSTKGPRHDNDHEDIRAIQVLPTWQEVKSLRQEYLPVKDPGTWHKSGIQGLLDRHFRLLREDTVGQLRDAVHAEVSRMEDPNNRSTQHQNGRQGLRTYTYDGVSVADFSIDRKDGLRFLVSFPQPPHVRSMSAQKRSEWWTQSRRLQPDALVCLFDKTGLLLFCSVVSEPAKARGTSESAEAKSTKEERRSLYADSKTAFVELYLVEQSDQHFEDLLRRCWNFRQMSLVEFPGVLLPAFQPTLQALQQMSVAGDVPFSELLAPSQNAAGIVRIPPPAYARRPGFHFSLSSITNGVGNIQLSPQKDFDAKELVQSSSLDNAQAKAVVDSLTQSFALIQGPPGTGKSYTGIALIKVLLDNRKATQLGPIVCVCYTNHALDQLLEHLVVAGISRIIRVGSRSKSELLKPFMLREVSKGVEKTKTEKCAAWEVGKQLEQDEKEIKELINALSNADSWQSVKEYLQQHSPSQHDEIFGSDSLDEDGWTLQAEHPKDALLRWLCGGPSLPSGNQERPVSLLRSASLIKMSSGERKKLHRYWIKLLRDKIQRNLVHALGEYNDRRTEHRRNRLEMDLRCLQEAQIIGITTSGLARNLEILRRVRAKVMICEEAGEVMESHTLTAMLPSVEHAIFIGDHEQLRPQIQRYDLGREHPHGERYSLDVSLFERLVRPDDDTAIKLPYTKLEMQRRMHPMISQLVRDTLYPALQDASSTRDYPMVPGMRDRLFWFDHREYEAGSDQSQGVTTTSRTNDFEVDMTMGLVSHLMKQGTYQADDIAVLTPYLGQLHKLRSRLSQMWELIINDRDLDELEKAGISGKEVSKTSALKALKVATVDNFQGEEAKVVIISLVRSNEMNSCGFLKTSNRINVLLSRAQHGMFIIGNSRTAGSVQMWQDVLDIMRASGNIGTSFELRCPRHPDTLITAGKPDNFTQYSPEGGCDLRPIKGCDHSCPRVCGVECPQNCEVPMFDPDRKLPCGHSKADLPCWQSQDLATVTCKTKVLRTIPGCNHEVMLPCHVDFGSDSFKCPARCGELLACGHACKSTCGRCKIRENGVIVREDHGICQQLRAKSSAATPVATRCATSRVLLVPSGLVLPTAPTAPAASLALHRATGFRARRGFCQLCATDDVKDQQVDFIEMLTYKEVDLDEDPCLFPPCGHIMTMANMDGHMDMHKHYVTAPDGAFVGLKPAPPFSNDELKACPTCRGPLRNISRYGRIVRRALLDESTKKFIVWSNAEYLQLQSRFQDAHSELTRTADDIVINTLGPVELTLAGNPSDLFQKMEETARSLGLTARYRPLFALRTQIHAHVTNVQHEEQPFRKVHDFCQDARRRGRGAGGHGHEAASSSPSSNHSSFTFSPDVLQTRALLLASALLLRCDLALLADLAGTWRNKLLLRTPADAIINSGAALVDLTGTRRACVALLHDANAAHSPAQAVEAFLFHAQSHAIERPFQSANTNDQSLRDQSLSHIAAARTLAAAHPGTTAGLASELDAVERMLRDATFFTVVTSEERRAVLAAMQAEFRGTGHWYYCANGHPFTVGECGLPMQLAVCPQCGEAAGGRGHRPAEGVRRAEDLERELLVEGVGGLRL